MRDESAAAPQMTGLAVAGVGPPSARTKPSARGPSPPSWQPQPLGAALGAPVWGVELGWHFSAHSRLHSCHIVAGTAVGPIHDGQPAPKPATGGCRSFWASQPDPSCARSPCTCGRTVPHRRDTTPASWLL